MPTCHKHGSSDIPHQHYPSPSPSPTYRPFRALFRPDELQNGNMPVQI